MSLYFLENKGIGDFNGIFVNELSPRGCNVSPTASPCLYIPGESEE